MTPKLKKIIITIVVLGILFLMYTIFLKPDPQLDPLVSGRDTEAGRQVSENAQVLGAQISQALLKIEKIELDRSIFNNDIFASLEDHSEPIIDEPTGRLNPFAPLSDTSVNVGSRTNINLASSTASSTVSRAATSTASAASSTRPN